MAEKLTATARSRVRSWALALATALPATVLAFALGIALQVLGAPVVTGAAPGSAAAAAEQCYAWDVFNATGADADGLHVRLAGVQTITNVYSGDANLFGAPRPGGSYDAPGGSYAFTLGLNAVTVAAGEAVRVGVCTPDTVTGARIQWLAGASPVGDVVQPPAVTWEWPSSGEMQVQVKNSTAATVTLLALRLLAPETMPTVDDLDGAVAANLDAAAAELEDPVLLGPNGVFSSSLALAAEGPGQGEPVLLAVEWAAEDDLSASATAYIATSVAAQQQMFLPFVLR